VRHTGITLPSRRNIGIQGSGDPPTAYPKDARLPRVQDSLVDCLGGFCSCGGRSLQDETAAQGSSPSEHDVPGGSNLRLFLPDLSPKGGHNPLDPQNVRPSMQGAPHQRHFGKKRCTKHSGQKNVPPLGPGEHWMPEANLVARTVGTGGGPMRVYTRGDLAQFSGFRSHRPGVDVLVVLRVSEKP